MICDKVRKDDLRGLAICETKNFTLPNFRALNVAKTYASALKREEGIVLQRRIVENPLEFIVTRGA